jgi:ATP-binding cassette subfamily B protein
LENIRIGRPNATDQEVIEAAKAAQCHEFVNKLPEKYNTLAGDAGNKLSGGEKQRLTIARAILKDAPIIVLDEATSLTDPENEDRIQEAINNLISGKTLIVIAHRISSIIEADNILLMDNGKLSTMGTHDELLIRSKKYKKLWDSHAELVQWQVEVKEGRYVQCC